MVFLLSLFSHVFTFCFLVLIVVENVILNLMNVLRLYDVIGHVTEERFVKFMLCCQTFYNFGQEHQGSSYK